MQMHQLWFLIALATALHSATEVLKFRKFCFVSARIESRGHDILLVVHVLNEKYVVGARVVVSLFINQLLLSDKNVPEHMVFEAT